jgi:hypothetical protein
MASIPACVKTVLLSEQLWWVFPTPCSYYLNRERVRESEEMPGDLSTADWALRERHALLTSSEDRMRSLEGKGPGLATINAVVAAAVVAAITVDWGKTMFAGRVLLVGAAVYSAFSLVMPIYLVGPLKRSTIHLPELAEAGQSKTPEIALAERAAVAAMENNLRNLRLSNLLDAARRELTYAFVLLLLWAFLVPATGLLKR